MSSFCHLLIAWISENFADTFDLDKPFKAAVLLTAKQGLEWCGEGGERLIIRSLKGEDTIGEPRDMTQRYGEGKKAKLFQTQIFSWKGINHVHGDKKASNLISEFCFFRCFFHHLKTCSWGGGEGLSPPPQDVFLSIRMYVFKFIFKYHFLTPFKIKVQRVFY